jgi:hypothetical protein
LRVNSVNPADPSQDSSDDKTCHPRRPAMLKRGVQ